MSPQSQHTVPLRTRSNPRDRQIIQAAHFDRSGNQYGGSSLKFYIMNCVGLRYQVANPRDQACSRGGGPCGHVAVSCNLKKMDTMKGHGGTVLVRPCVQINQEELMDTHIVRSPWTASSRWFLIFGPFSTVFLWLARPWSGSLSRASLCLCCSFLDTDVFKIAARSPGAGR